MKIVKVVLSNDKIEFFTELMDRLGIRYEDEQKVQEEARRLRDESERLSGLSSSGIAQRSNPMADSTVKEVLKRIEEMRNRKS